MAEVKTPIPVWQLYGEQHRFPDVLHIERIVDRAEGLEWRISPHRHLHLHQVLLLQSGTAVFNIDGAELQLTSRTVLNIPRETVHGFRFSAGAEGFVLTLPIEVYDDLFGPEAPTTQIAQRPFVLPATPVMSEGMERIAQVYKGASTYRSLNLRATCVAVMADLFSAADGADDTPAQRQDDARIARFLDLIRDNSRNRWSVAEYADALAVSPRHLGRLCHEATGQSPKELIEAEVIREACRLLVYTRMPIQQVAWQLGFDDASHFSRRFRSATGHSARDYRRGFET